MRFVSQCARAQLTNRFYRTDLGFDTFCSAHCESRMKSPFYTICRSSSAGQRRRKLRWMLSFHFCELRPELLLRDSDADLFCKHRNKVTLRDLLLLVCVLLPHAASLRQGPLKRILSIAPIIASLHANFGRSSPRSAAATVSLTAGFVTYLHSLSLVRSIFKLVLGCAVPVSKVIVQHPKI